MATVVHLDLAPITEAIFDFRVKARSSLSAAEFQPLVAKLKDRFPTAEQRVGRRFSIELGIQGPASGQVDDLGPQGLILRSADNKLIAQFRTDGFTVNRLTPYTSWAELSPLVFDLFDEYLRIAQPDAVIRMAMRFVNRMSLPPGVVELSDYLAAPPTIPASLPQELIGFLSRVTIHDTDRALNCNVIQTIEPSSTGSDAVLLLDVDAIWEGECPSDGNKAREIMSAIHELKNEVFFGFVTDKLLEAYR